MLRGTLISLALIAMIGLPGCGNLSPRINPELQQQLDKIEGQQNTLENNQNSIKIELGRLQNALEVTGENNQVQQGWLNVQADGIIIGVFALITISLLLYYMYRSTQYKKISMILADQVRLYDDDELTETVMAAAWNTEVEKTIYKMMR